EASDVVITRKERPLPPPAASATAAAVRGSATAAHADPAASASAASPAAGASASAAAPAVPPVAHYHVTLADVEDFPGARHSRQGWAAYTGWADHAEIDLAADVTASGLANLRLQQVVLYGSTTPDGLPRRLAEVHRPQLTLKGAPAP